MQGFSNALINMMALFSAIILNSCVSTQYNINQNIPPKEACAFVLDTIHINNPVIIEYNNIRYVVDTPNVDSIPQKDIYAYLDSTFHYLLGDNIFYDLPNFLYEKVCQWCGKNFIARTTQTAYCSKRCAEHAYKDRKRKEKMERCKEEVRRVQTWMKEIDEKEFLTPRQAAQYLGLCYKTFYIYINKGVIKAWKLNRKTLVKRY